MKTCRTTQVYGSTSKTLLFLNPGYERDISYLIPMLEGYDIICFAPTDFWGMNPSCTTHIMKMLSRKNLVLYVNPFSSDLAGERRGIWRRVPRKIKSMAKFLRRVGNNFYVFSPWFLPIQGTKTFDALNNLLLRVQLGIVRHITGIHRPLLWIENLRAADMLDYFDPVLTVFHISDLFAECPYTVNRQILRRREEIIINRSDLIICVSQRLQQAKSKSGKKVAYLPHGVDFEFFREADENDAELENLKQVPRPRAGYFGTMTANNDIELLSFCAQKLPHISFVLAGEITGGDYSQLTKLDNVHFLGKVPYEKIPNLCASFDVCMLQWKMNDWIRHCNPLKLFEYMASGRPIVSVPIEEVKQYCELLSIAESKEAFCEAILWEMEHDTPERAKHRIEIARKHSWNNHIEQLSLLIIETRQALSQQKAEPVATLQ